MNIISRKAHGVLDYVVGAVLIFAPQMFGFDSGGPEQGVPVFLGIATLIYSFLTNYELGLIKIIPFRLHLGLDILNAMVLTASPWLFAFSDRVWVPHLVLGLTEIAVISMTRKPAPDESAPGTPAHT